MVSKTRDLSSVTMQRRTLTALYIFIVENPPVVIVGENTSVIIFKTCDKYNDNTFPLKKHCLSVPAFDKECKC